MKRRSLLGGALALTAGVSSAYAQDITFFRIVTGGTVGTYFPIGGLIANALAGVVRGAAAQGGLSKPDLLANVARMAVWAFAVVVAVNQIGIATELVNTLFMAVVGGVGFGKYRSYYRSYTIEVESKQG
mgnify:CR=1 FL=1